MELLIATIVAGISSTIIYYICKNCCTLCTDNNINEHTQEYSNEHNQEYSNEHNVDPFSKYTNRDTVSLLFSEEIYNSVMKRDYCAMCTELFKIDDVIIRLPCNHIFHKTEEQPPCIFLWIKNKKTCPICNTHIQLIT